MKRKNKAAQELGRKGGKITGASKVRGDSNYYRELAAKRKPLTTPAVALKVKR